MKEQIGTIAKRTSDGRFLPPEPIMREQESELDVPDRLIDLFMDAWMKGAKNV